MRIMTLLWRNIKWRYHNAFTIFITILQPMLWLTLYSWVAKQSMEGIGIENYTAFILPGLVILISFGCCSSSGIMNYLMKNDGSFYRVLIAPVHRSSIIIAQLLEATLCTFLEVSIMMLYSFLFSATIAFHIIDLIMMIVIIFLCTFTMSSLSYAISLILPNEMIYETAMNAIVLPVFFLSTALFPIETMSGILKTAVNLNPFSHVINALRSLLQGSMDLDTLTRLIILLLILCSLSFSWAYRRLKKVTDI